MEDIVLELKVHYEGLADITGRYGGIVMYGQVAEDIAYPRTMIKQGLDLLDTMVNRLRKGGE